MSEYIDTLNINDVDYDIKDSGALHQSDVAAVATSGSYSDLTSKPKINNVELTGNKTAAQLGLQAELTIDATPTANSTNPVQSGGVYEALEHKPTIFFTPDIMDVPPTILNKVKVGDVIQYGDDAVIEVTVAVKDEQSDIVILVYNDGMNVGGFQYQNGVCFDAISFGLTDMANKVSGATNGNLAGLAANGDLTDSGIAASDVATTSDLAGKQDTISDLSTIRSGAALGATSVQSSEKGAASGVATLDSGGKVPQSQLPSYVDDVLEYANLASFPATGESGKIYVALDTNKTYRWSGSAYVEIAQGLALGETSSTAFPGDRGKAIEDKIPSSASSSNKLATDSDVVHKTGAETVAGRKTFSDGIVIALDNNIRFNTDSQGHGVDVFASEDMDNVKHLSLADMEHEDDCRLGGIATPDVSNDAANKGYVDGQVSAKYTKPSTGIPASDLASAVQTSLGKADTALQSYTETDPVFTASAAHGISSTDISNWNAKGTYSKPSGGIPSTDLASAVQTSLGKADTALQSETDPVFSASPAAGITSGDISDWDDKAEPIPVVNVSTVPASMDADKFYDYGTLSADIIFPSLNTPGDATKAHVFWWTFKVPATAPNVGWPASGITEWSGGSPPDINASTTYEIMVNNGFASYIMST